MYEVSVEAAFRASHRVQDQHGDLEPAHEHDWHVRATFVGPELDEAGILVDFVAAQRKLRETVALLHGTDLNECPVMKDLGPSAERVAKVIYDLMAQEMPLCRLLDRVRVEEAPGCTASYVAPRVR